MTFFNPKNLAPRPTLRRAIRGLLAALTCALFFAGCSGGSDGPGGFTASPDPVGGNGGASVSRLIFNLARTQGDISVGALAQTVRFELYTGLNAGGALLQAETRPFAAQQVFENVPDAVRSVRVTSFDEFGFPLNQFTADTELTGVEELVVSAASGQTEAITLESISVTPGTLNIGLGSTSELTTRAVFSNGQQVVVPNDQNLLTFSTANASVASVSTLGVVNPAVAGTTNITVDFRGQSQSVPVTVSDAVSGPREVTNLELRAVGNPGVNNVQVPLGASQQFEAVATFEGDTQGRVVTASEGVVFSVSDQTGNFTITPDGSVTVAAGATINSATIVRASFQGRTSNQIQVRAAVKQPDQLLINPSVVSLPFGGFEQKVQFRVLFTDGTVSDLDPGPMASNLDFTNLGQNRVNIADTEDTVFTALNAPAAGAGTDRIQVDVRAGVAAGFTGFFDVTAGEVSVQDLIVTPDSTTVTVGEVAEFTVLAVLDDSRQVDVTEFASLQVTSPSGDVVVNGRRIVGIQPTAPDPSRPINDTDNIDQPVLVTIGLAAGPAVGGVPSTVESFLNVSVLAEFIDSVRYFFAGNPVPDNNTVNLPRGYVGIFEVEATFNTGAVRMLLPSEYDFAEGDSSTPAKIDALRRFDNNYQPLADVHPRYFDGLPIGATFDADGNPLTFTGEDPQGPNFPLPQDSALFGDPDTDPAPVDDQLEVQRVRSILARVDDLYTFGPFVGHRQVVAVDPDVDPAPKSDDTTVRTRDTFRAVAADWRRGELDVGGTLPRANHGQPPVAGELLVSDAPNAFVAPNAQRNFDFMITGNTGGVTDFDERISVTITDPPTVEFASAGFANYPEDNLIAVGSVREFEIRVNFGQVNIPRDPARDEPGNPDLLPPDVDPQENFKLADANIVLATDGEDDLLFHTPTDIGFVGLSAPVEVDIALLNVGAQPLGGPAARPIADGLPNWVQPADPSRDPVYTPATYSISENIFGVYFSAGDTPEEGFNPFRDPGPSTSNNIPDNRPPADGQIIVLTTVNEGQGVDVVTPFLFSLGTEGSNEPLTEQTSLVERESLTLRTLVQFEPGGPILDRSLDYRPVVPALVPLSMDSNPNPAGAFVTRSEEEQDENGNPTGIPTGRRFVTAVESAGSLFVRVLDAVGQPITPTGGGVPDTTITITAAP